MIPFKHGHFWYLQVCNGWGFSFSSPHVFIPTSPVFSLGLPGSFVNTWFDNDIHLHLKEKCARTFCFYIFFPAEKREKTSTIFDHLVGGFNPFENISQNGNLPQVRVKIKSIWNHHLVMFFFNYSKLVVEPTHLKKMLVKLDHLASFRGENTKCLSCHHLGSCSWLNSGIYWGRWNPTMFKMLQNVLLHVRYHGVLIEVLPPKGGPKFTKSSFSPCRLLCFCSKGQLLRYSTTLVILRILVFFSSSFRIGNYIIPGDHYRSPKIKTCKNRKKWRNSQVVGWSTWRIIPVSKCEQLWLVSPSKWGCSPSK